MEGLRRHHLVWQMALAVVVVLMLGSCGSPSRHAKTAATTTTSTAPSSTDAPSTTTTSAVAAGTSSPTTRTTAHPTSTGATSPARAGTTHSLTEADNGHTVAARRGDRITITLSSTYWKFDAPSNGAVVRQDGDPVYAPDRSCVPGGGCGTVTASYTVIGPGSTHLTANRSSCGEARGCSGNEGKYDVTVTAP